MSNEEQPDKEQEVGSTEFFGVDRDPKDSIRKRGRKKKEAVEETHAAPEILEAKDTEQSFRPNLYFKEVSADAPVVVLKDVKDIPPVDIVPVGVKEEMVLPVVDAELEKIKADPSPLADKVRLLVSNATSQQISRALNIHRLGGTVAINKDGTLSVLPSRHPDKGGKQALARTGKVKVFVSDLAVVRGI